MTESDRDKKPTSPGVRAGAPDRDSDRRTDRGSQRCEPRSTWRRDWLHLGFRQQDLQGDGAPHPAHGDECWVKSDLEADAGHIHTALDGDGVDLVEGHTMNIIQEDAVVHRHLLRGAHITGGGPEPGGSTPMPLGPLLPDVQTCI